MTLTIQDILDRLEILSGSVLVAGQKGSNRIVSWAHVVDLPDVIPWVREGDLLLITAYAIKDDLQAQLNLISALHSKGISGLIIALGPYFQRVPDGMRKLADDLRFPLIFSLDA